MSGDISPEQAQLDAAAGARLLIDIRAAHEWHETGTAPDAVLLTGTDADFAERVAELTGGNLQAPLAIVCAGGVRSAAMQQRLQGLGYTDVLNVTGGMRAWGEQPRRPYPFAG